MDRSLKVFDGTRGAWLGFNKGLYRQDPKSKMEKTCLNDETRGNWIEAYSVFLGTDDLDDSIDMLTAFGDILLIFANLTKCELRAPWRDMYHFCASENEPVSTVVPTEYDFDDLDAPVDRCSFTTILNNLSKNAFVLMGKGSSIAALIQEFPAEDPDSLMVQAMTLGEDLGTFIRVGLDFTKP